MDERICRCAKPEEAANIAGFVQTELTFPIPIRAVFLVASMEGLIKKQKD